MLTPGCDNARQMAGALVGWTVGDVVRRLREQRGWSQSELAERAGVHKNSVGRIENHDGDPKEGTLRAIAGAFELELDRLYGMVPRPAPPARQEAEPLDVDVYTGYVKDDLPVITEGDASPRGELLRDIEEGRALRDVEHWTSRPFDVRDQQAYAIKVRGDSMLPVFEPGMVLIVSPNTPVKVRGDNAYVQLHNGERLVKRVRRQEGGWILESYNRAYETRFVPADEVGSVHRIVYAKF